MNTKSAIIGPTFGVFTILMMVSITGLTEVYAEDFEGLLFYPLTGELIQNPKNGEVDSNIVFLP